MSKSVIINGTTYENVPYVNIPLASGSGNAKFVDTDSGDAVASDMRNGKKAWVDGSEISGTIPEKSGSDVTVNGKTVTVPAGLYDEQVSKSVQDGSATPTATITGIELGDTASDYPVEVTPKATVNTPGYVTAIGDGSKITKYIQVETKEVTPSITQQTINPVTGKLLKAVTVNAVDVGATATEADVLSGKTFFANNLTQKVGTAHFPTVGQDSSTKVLTIS